MSLENWALGYSRLDVALSKDLTTFAADTALGDVDLATQYAALDGSSADAQVSEWTPSEGNIYVLRCLDSTNTTSFQLSTGLFFNGGTTDALVMGAADDLAICFAMSATLVLCLSAVGTISFA